MDTRDLTDEMHEEFYRYISHNPDKPRFKLHYKTDAPLDIKALFYIPEVKPSKCRFWAITELIKWLYRLNGMKSFWKICQIKNFVVPCLGYVVFEERRLIDWVNTSSQNEKGTDQYFFYTLSGLRTDSHHLSLKFKVLRLTCKSKVVSVSSLLHFC